MIQHDIGIYVNYSNNVDPRHVLGGMKHCIDAIEFTDGFIASQINGSLYNEYKTQSFSGGSLRSLIKYLLSIPGDSDIKDSSVFEFPVKLIGAYVVEARKHFIDAFNRMEKHGYMDSIEYVKEKMYMLLKDSHLNYLGTPLMIPNIAIAECFNEFQSASEYLDELSEISVASPSGTIALNRAPRISIEDLSVEDTSEHKCTIILGIKKPDFLNVSQWNVIYNGKNMRANIKDSNFILEFLKRKTTLLPGDSIRADVVIRQYGRQNVIDVMKVREILNPGNNDRQENWLTSR